MADNDNSFGAFLAGILIGGLVGAAAALLLAPQSGEETRAQIREKSIELRDRASETVEEARARADQSLEIARHRVEELSQQVKQKASTSKSGVPLSDTGASEPE